jgi:hypothetical protein
MSDLRVFGDFSLFFYFFSRAGCTRYRSASGYIRPFVSVSTRVGNKKPTQNTPKKPQKTHPKNPLKMFFLGFLNFLIFYENNTNFKKDFL